jgi:hypothetical protein
MHIALFPLCNFFTRFWISSDRPDMPGRRKNGGPHMGAAVLFFFRSRCAAAFRSFYPATCARDKTPLNSHDENQQIFIIAEGFLT